MKNTTANRHAFGPPPTLADIEAMADRAWGEIPAPLRQHAEGVILRVVDFPDDETLAAMDLASPFDLLGLYHGGGRPVPGPDDAGRTPDMVFLYRRPILDYWVETGEDLPHLVRHVMIHEIGHHFGFSDDDMHAIEEAAEEDV